ncbi:MAG: hypothetical protein ACK56W_08070 [Pirellula sp.]
MGFLFKQKVTRKLPVNVEIKERRRKATTQEPLLDPSQITIIEKIARWKDRSGRFTEGVVIGERVRVSADTYSARFRDGDDIVRTIATGCRDKSEAASILANLEREAEKVRAGVLTSSGLATAAASKKPLSQHIEDYAKHLRNQRGKGKRIRISELHVGTGARCVSR